jgi:hypothetical protein
MRLFLKLLISLKALPFFSCPLFPPLFTPFFWEQNLKIKVATYLPIYETYFLQNWLLRGNQMLTQSRFIPNGVITGIQWMVHWWV